MQTKLRVSAWSRHNCTSAHRTSRTFIKCCLDRYYFNGENAHKPSIRFHGAENGDWVVIRESWSDVYYTEHNGRTNNQTHKVFEVAILNTYEAACDFYDMVSSSCWEDTCNGGRCVNVRQTIIKVDY